MKVRVKKTIYCQLPTPGNIAGRSSSITNAFFNAIIPIHNPTDEEALEALAILEMDPNDIRCAYCGDKFTEWDHLRAIITDQKPTGYHHRNRKSGSCVRQVQPIERKAGLAHLDRKPCPSLSENSGSG